MTHDTFRDLLPLYVIGALDASELRDFEQYCAANRALCETEIAEFQAIANQFALDAPPAKPSPAVLTRIMAEIDPPVPQRMAPVNEHESVGLAAFLRWVPWSVAAALCAICLIALWQLNGQHEIVREINQTDVQLNEERIALHAQISELTTRLDEQSRNTQTELDRLRTVNQQLTRERDDWRQQVERQNLKVASLQGDFERQSANLNLMMDPGVHIGQLTDPDKKSNAAAKIFWEPVKNAGLVIVSNLSAVPKGGAKSLELWVICEGQAPIPAGLFWTDAAGHGVGQIKMDRQVACAPKFAVSVEPAAGVDSPTGPIVLLGQ